MAIGKVFLLFIAAAQALRAAPARAPAAEQPGWQTIFEDNFDSLSSRDWTVYDYGRNYARFLPANVAIRDGKYVITTKVQASGGYAYTSGGIHSQKKHAFHPDEYGGKIRMEASVKIPKGKGIWPAFWTLSDGGGWPPEIDIYETLGLFPKRIYMTYHWGHDNATHKSKGAVWEGDFDYSQDYHRYAVVWTPDSLVWEVDGVKRAKYADAATIGELKAQYLILYTQMGGWDGNWPITDASFLPAETAFDWVRVSKWGNSLSVPRRDAAAPGPERGRAFRAGGYWRWFGRGGEAFDLSGRERVAER
jgi:beta-glucanase (GH16 family)